MFLEQTRSPNVSQVAREKLIEQVVTDWKFHVDVKRKMKGERLTGFCRILKKKNNCIKRCSLSSEKESHMKFIYRMRGNPFLAKRIFTHAVYKFHESCILHLSFSKQNPVFVEISMNCFICLRQRNRVLCPFK